MLGGGGTEGEWTSGRDGRVPKIGKQLWKDVGGSHVARQPLVDGAKRREVHAVVLTHEQGRAIDAQLEGAVRAVGEAQRLARRHQLHVRAV